MKKKTVMSLLVATALATAPTVAVLSPDKILAAEVTQDMSGVLTNTDNGSDLAYNYEASSHTLFLSGIIRGIEHSNKQFNWENIPVSEINHIRINNLSLYGNMKNLFMNFTNLRDLAIDNIDTSNATQMDSMFYNCSSLENLDLSGFDTSKVAEMNAMFYGCTSLRSLDLSSFDTSKVTNMGGMFEHCENLESLNLSSFDTSKVIHMSGMFGYCENLKSLNLSSFDTSNVILMADMFYNCSSLENLDLSSFDTSNVILMPAMFYNCSSLENLDLSGFDTSKVTDMEFLFRGCEVLKKLDVSGFSINENTDTQYFFCNNRKLDIIKCPKTIKKAIDLPDTDYQGKDFYDTAEVIQTKTVYQSLTASNENMTIRAYRQLHISYYLDGEQAFFKNKNTGSMEYVQSYIYKNYKVGEKADLMEHLGDYDTSNYDLISDKICTISADPVTNVSANFKTPEDKPTTPVKPVKPEDKPTTPIKPVKPEDKPTTPAIPVKNDVDVPDTSDTGAMPYLLSSFFGILAIIKAKIFKK